MREIDHYQLLVVKNMVDDKYSGADLTKTDATLQAELAKFKEINKQVHGVLLHEELNQRQSINNEFLHPKNLKVKSSW